MQLVEDLPYFQLQLKCGKKTEYRGVLLEALKGGDLSYHLVKFGPFTVHQSRIYFKQLVSALIHIKSTTGLVHRDIKPWNIVLSDDLQSVKVIDFGLASPSRKSEVML